MKPVAVFAVIIFALATAAAAAEHDFNDAAKQYNRGTAEYRRQAYPKAEEALRGSVASAKPGLQGKAAYNLASAQYRQGVQAALKDPEKAKALFQQALDNYRLAIRRNPRDKEAQYNYELTQKHLESLKQDQKQEQQKQQQESKQSDKQDGKEQAAQKQQAQSQAAEEKQEQQQAEKQSEEAKQESAEASQSVENKDKGEKQAQAADFSGTKEGKEEKSLSEQQALWILDNIQREEYGARANQTQKQAQEQNVDQDW